MGLIFPHHGKWPEVHETAFIAPSCDLIGEVKIGAYSSVWFQCVVRGDVNTISIGERTNIQDLSILHVTRKTAPLIIGDQVTVGHHAVLHGCTIKNRVLIGMGAVVMDGAEINDDTIVGAGSLVTPGKKYRSGVLIAGSPAKVIRELTIEELNFLKQSAENYVGDAMEYQKDLRGPKKFGQSGRDLEEILIDEDGRIIR